ncbi:hypothetical protein SNEBB_001377 [Seison nebaliae]|nr:hypothetical protein SNEBB_001377 [Seison nebaliae]
MSSNEYMCDYAKTGRSSCKRCKKQIEKGTTRIAKLSQNVFSSGEDKMKSWYHVPCIFDTFTRARPTTKIIDSTEDLQGFSILDKEDRKEIIHLISKQSSSKKRSSTTKRPKKHNKNVKRRRQSTSEEESSDDDDDEGDESDDEESSSSSTDELEDDDGHDTDEVTENPSMNMYDFGLLIKSLEKIAGHNDKTQCIRTFLREQKLSLGEKYLVIKLLLPQINKNTYNLQTKTIISIFSTIFHKSIRRLTDDTNESGNVAETMAEHYEKSKYVHPLNTTKMTIKEFDENLKRLAKLSKSQDQENFFRKLLRRCTVFDLQLFIRSVKKDLRINSGPKQILSSLGPDVYDAFQASRNLKDVIERNEIRYKSKKGRLMKALTIRASLMTPVLPMLAKPCKSSLDAVRGCPHGMMVEVKYDGERIQIHKNGDDFQFFSRSLKNVPANKLQYVEKYVPKAFVGAKKLIIDAEVLLVDNKTEQPLPFGTLGTHKRMKFADASVCLFVFDILQYNDQNLFNTPLIERRKLLEKNITPIKNHIRLSQLFKAESSSDVDRLMRMAINKKLEGIMIKDKQSVYEPGKRHWLKMKKDYLAKGAMADTADLVVLGAYYGTGSKGGLMSTFLMGCFDNTNKRWLTVTKCANGFTDSEIVSLQKTLQVKKISQDLSEIPFNCEIDRSIAPDFIVKDPRKSPVWEITGAEFSKSDKHSAGGISIRFPRVTRVRKDKDWTSATDLQHLKYLYKTSTRNMSKNLEKYDDEMMEDDEEKIEILKVSDEGKEEIDVDVEPIHEVDDDEDDKEIIEKDDEKKDDVVLDNPLLKESASSESESEDDDDAEEISSILKKIPRALENTKFYIEENVENRKELIRLIYIFDGEIMTDIADDNITHCIIQKADDKESYSKVLNNVVVHTGEELKKILMCDT